MGSVYAEIILKNANDNANCARGLIKEQDVHSVTVNALVDTGAMSLVINEDMCKKLGLRIIGEKSALVANGKRVYCKVTEPVEINWKNRASSIRAVVVPGARKVLLGVIPLEDMDLMVNPGTRELIGAHGDTVECLICNLGGEHENSYGIAV